MHEDEDTTHQNLRAVVETALREKLTVVNTYIYSSDGNSHLPTYGKEQTKPKARKRKETRRIEGTLVT